MLWIYLKPRGLFQLKNEQCFYKHSGKTMVPIQKSKFLKKENEQVFVESGGIYVLKEERFLMKANDKKIGHIEIDEGKPKY